MTIDKTQITRRSECLPGIVRYEIYEYKDIAYREQYDDETGKMVFGKVDMFGGVNVCTVYPNGSINVTIPTDTASNHERLMWLIEDLQRLDEFLSAVVENYH